MRPGGSSDPDTMAAMVRGYGAWSPGALCLEARGCVASAMYVLSFFHDGADVR